MALCPCARSRMDHAVGCRLKRPMNGFVVFSDSTVDKVNFVIFVITPVLLELQIDKATRLRLPAFFKSAFF